MNEGKSVLLDEKETEIEGKTFTQEDVNRIVQERLARERSKESNGNEELEKRAAELDKRERRLNAIEKLREKDLPDYLVDALNMNTEEDLDRSIESILKMKGEIKPEERFIRKANVIGEVRSGSFDYDGLRDAFGL